MADEFEQFKQNSNIVVRGLNINGDPKTNLINMITSGLGIHVTERDIKFLIKLTLKNEREGTTSVKVALFDQRLRDEIYASRLKLKGFNVYIGEDLTQKKSTLAYEARQYAKSTENATTWSTDGTIFQKDSADAKPCAIHNKADLKPEDPNRAQK